MKDKYVSLNYVLKNAIKKDYLAILEYRPKKYMFNTYNYGEIIGLINKADHDRWDIFIPGYERKLEINKTYKITGIIGVLILENGNHKIAIKTDVDGYNTENSYKEIEIFTKTYLEKNKKKGRWVQIE